MPDTPLRKTSAMRLLERLYPGRSIEEIIEDTISREPTPEAAAVALGVSSRTLWRWQQQIKRQSKCEREAVPA